MFRTKATLLLALFCCLSCCIIAQGNYDSLRSYIQRCSNDSLRMEGMIKLHRTLELSYPDSANHYNQKILALAQKINCKRGEGVCYENNGNYYNAQANYPKALEWYVKASKVYSSAKLQKELGNAYNSIGNTYLGINNNEKALDYYQLSRDIAMKRNDAYHTAIANVGISSVLSKHNNHRGALNALFSAKKNFESTKSTYALGVVLANIGESYAALGKLDSANDYFEQSISLNQQVGNTYAIFSTLLLEGNLLAKQGKHQQAIALFEKSLALSIENKARSAESENHLAIAESYKALKNYQAAYDHLVSYMNTKDSLFNETNSKQLAEVQTKYETEKKDDEIKILNQQKQLQQNSINKQQLIIVLSLSGIGIVLLIALLIYRNSARNKKLNELLSQKNSIIEAKNTSITDSILYAKKIQQVILPEAEFLHRYIKNMFALYLPKDIVSGDFYYATVTDKAFYLALCDSTGHGVPGAFMSLLNSAFLSEAINEKQIDAPNKIFDYVRERLIANVGKEGQQDGFDGILLRFDLQTKKISYAAANNTPVIIHANELFRLANDRMPVGLGIRKDAFNLYELSYTEGDLLYLYSDGYADQFGGPNGKKFKYKKLNELLMANRSLTLPQQCELLKINFENWKGLLEQIDDVCIIGIQL